MAKRGCKTCLPQDMVTGATIPTPFWRASSPRTGRLLIFFKPGLRRLLVRGPWYAVRTAVFYMVSEVSPRFLALHYCGHVPLRLSPRPFLLSGLCVLRRCHEGGSTFDSFGSDLIPVGTDGGSLRPWSQLPAQRRHHLHATGVKARTATVQAGLFAGSDTFRSFLLGVSSIDDFGSSVVSLETEKEKVADGKFLVVQRVSD